MGRGRKPRIERARQAGPVTCDRSQVRGRTPLALSEDEGSYLPRALRRVWRRVCDDRRSLG